MQRIITSGMRRLVTVLAATGLCVTATSLASANTGTSIFTGTVLSTCVIGPVGTPGIMTASPDLKKLSSKNGGLATPSTMALVTTGGVTVSISPTVTGLSLAPGDTGTITWTPSFEIGGAHPFVDGIVDRILNGAGVDTVTINLEGQKSGNNVFSTGVYTATVTLTCEPSS